MKKLLRQKAKVSPSFVKSLLNSGSKVLVHSTSYGSDLFWSSGLNSYKSRLIGAEFPGKNTLGILLMKL